MRAWIAVVLGLVAASFTAQAQTKIPARGVSIPIYEVLSPTNQTLLGATDWINARWPTNIDKTVRYWPLAEGQSYLQSYVATSTIPGTNMTGNVWYDPTTRTWEVHSISSNISTTISIITNNYVNEFLTIISNGAPVLVDYLDLTNRSPDVWQYYSTTNWNGAQTVEVDTWAVATSGGDEIGFAPGSGAITIPTNTFALFFFDGILKDSTTNGSSYVKFRYISGESTANLGDIAECNREEEDDTPSKIAGSYVRCWPAQSTPRTVRVAAYHRHASDELHVATKSRALRLQVLLLKSL